LFEVALEYGRRGEDPDGRIRIERFAEATQIGRRRNGNGHVILRAMTVTCPKIIIRRVFLIGKPGAELRVLLDPSSGMAAARAAEASS
jgi:hypothetical protein